MYIWAVCQANMTNMKIFISLYLNFCLHLFLGTPASHYLLHTNQQKTLEFTVISSSHELKAGFLH